MGDSVRKRHWSSAGKGRVESSEKELGTAAFGFLWILNVMGWLCPVELNKPESKGTNFCNIKPALKGYQDLSALYVTAQTPLIRENRGAISSLCIHNYLPSTGSAPWCCLGSFCRRETPQPLQLLGASGWTLLALQLPRRMGTRPGGPWTCLKSPNVLFSIVLVVETETLLLASPDTEVLP